MSKGGRSGASDFHSGSGWNGEGDCRREEVVGSADTEQTDSARAAVAGGHVDPGAAERAAAARSWAEGVQVGLLGGRIKGKGTGQG